MATRRDGRRRDALCALADPPILSPGGSGSIGERFVPQVKLTSGRFPRRVLVASLSGTVAVPVCLKESVHFGQSVARNGAR